MTTTETHQAAQNGASAPETHKAAGHQHANVTEALAAVMAALPGIGKDGKADPAQGGYSYRGIEQITSHAQALLGANGVVPYSTGSRRAGRQPDHRQRQAVERHDPEG